MATPEDQAREHIDQALEKSDWKSQGTRSAKLHILSGVASKNLSFISGHVFTDLLSVEWKTAGAIEAKEEGVTLAGIEAAAAIKNQHQIVIEVERRLSVIEELEAAVEANLTRADRLRQAVLSEAFSGCLVKKGANNHFSAIAT